MTFTSMRVPVDSLAGHALRDVARPLRMRGLLAWATAAALLALVLGALLFRALGGHWYVTQTASMGTAAPVGSLVIDQGAPASELRIGDVITFHPPTAAQQTYTHRIAGISPSGTITTRGDANGTDDGWQLLPKDVIGKAIAILPIAGWAVRAVPMFLAGSILLWQLRRLIGGAAGRSALLLAGFPLLLTATLAWLRPLVNLALVSASAQAHGTLVTVVSTGVLPVRVLAPSGAALLLSSGQVGRLHVPTPTGNGHYQIATGLDLPPWGWIVLVGLTMVPLLLSIAVSDRLARSIGVND
jgi:signal peptidase I